MYVIATLLYYVLIPGLFVRLPSGKGSLMMVSLVHACMFGILYYLFHHLVAHKEGVTNRQEQEQGQGQVTKEEKARVFKHFGKLLKPTFATLAPVMGNLNAEVNKLISDPNGEFVEDVGLIMRAITE